MSMITEKIEREKHCLVLVQFIQKQIFFLLFRNSVFFYKTNILLKQIFQNSFPFFFLSWHLSFLFLYFKKRRQGSCVALSHVRHKLTENCNTNNICSILILKTDCSFPRNAGLLLWLTNTCCRHQLLHNPVYSTVTESTCGLYCKYTEQGLEKALFGVVISLNV